MADIFGSRAVTAATLSSSISVSYDPSVDSTTFKGSVSVEYGVYVGMGIRYDLVYNGLHG
jgi:hypothetical protein